MNRVCILLIALKMSNIAILRKIMQEKFENDLCCCGCCSSCLPGNNCARRSLWKQRGTACPISLPESPLSVQRAPPKTNTFFDVGPLRFNSFLANLHSTSVTHLQKERTSVIKVSSQSVYRFPVQFIFSREIETSSVPFALLSLTTSFHAALFPFSAGERLLRGHQHGQLRKLRL